MEAPATTSGSQSSSIGQTNSAGSDKYKRSIIADRSRCQNSMASTSYIQINPSLAYSTPGRGAYVEELPENFMETISPQQNQQSVPQDTSQLGSLGSLSHETAYATLAPMTTQEPCRGSLKQESVHDNLLIGTMHRSNLSGALDKVFTSGPAGLLSPLQPNRTDGICNSIIGVQENGTRNNELLSIRRSSMQFGIKEEVDGDYKPLETSFLAGQVRPQSHMITSDDQHQELEHRLANAETPPAVSNVEIASKYLATMMGHSAAPLVEYSREQFGRRRAENHDGENVVVTTSCGFNASNVQARMDPISDNNGGYPVKDANELLNAEIEDNVYIDTKDLCKRVAWELKQHSIPQAVFADKILARSQGTLSDLLRNPKPWNKLKSGRETFRRMFNWLQQPAQIRLLMVDMSKGGNNENDNTHPEVLASARRPNISSGDFVAPMSPPTPAQNSRQNSRQRSRDGEGVGQPKRPRLVFTDIQKRTLQAIFKQTQRPSREMQQTISEHLRLDISTVGNFFMNARRRSRSGTTMSDEPAPYQQVRAITPPPSSPPSQRGQNRLRPRQLLHCEIDPNNDMVNNARIENNVTHVTENLHLRKEEEDDGSADATEDSVGSVEHNSNSIQTS